MFTYNPLYNKYGSFYLCYNPLKVAILPPINTAKYKYPDDVQVIQDNIKSRSNIRIIY